MTHRILIQVHVGKGLSGFDLYCQMYMVVFTRLACESYEPQVKWVFFFS